MGVSCLSSGNSSVSYTPTCDTKPNPNPNPNPNRFQIKEIWYANEFATLLLVNYPDCITFDGDKVLVYHGVHHWDYFLTRTTLDPQFRTNDMNYPIARFRGDKNGMELAKMFIMNVLTGIHPKLVYKEGEKQ